MKSFQKFFIDVHNVLINAVILSLWENICILMFKRAPEQEKLVFTDFRLLYTIWIFFMQDYENLFAKIFHDCKLHPNE